LNIVTEEVVSALKHVVHPAAGKNIVELNMVSDVGINGLNVVFTLTFVKVNDPMKNAIVKACEKALLYYLHPDIKPHINIMHHPSPTLPAGEGAVPEIKKQLAKNIIAIASGKGGVGKSTVAVNLAVASSKIGFSVGLLDADIYGPSMPKMLGVENVRPEVKEQSCAPNGRHEIIVPVEKYGVRMLSIGFFINPEDALIWRGPRATSAIRQLLNQGDWGELDYLVIDLPPGTGDIHLTIVQELPVTGAVIVSTPQNVALIDAIKGINMFQADNVNIPILGMVENMAWFTPEELPDNRYYIFGNGGCKALSEQKGIKFLGQIPIVQNIREGGDCGEPSATNEHSITGKAFMDLALNLIASINETNKV